MKILSLILTVLFFSFQTFSQCDYGGDESQITLTNEYSVDLPHLSIGGSYVHLVFATNFYYYRFPYTGVSAPMENPIIPAEGHYPYSVDIAVDKTDTNHIVIAFVDFKYDYTTEISFYGCYYVESFDWGNNWEGAVLLDTVQLGNTISNYQYNLPKVDFADNGDMYILWRTDYNSSVTKALYLSKNKGEKIRIDNVNNDEVEHEINFRVSNNGERVAISYGKQEDNHAKFYLRYSQDYGNTFSNEILVKDDGNTFMSFEAQTDVLLSTWDDNSLMYIFSDFDHGPQYYMSNDNGQSWSFYHSDNLRYTYHAFTETLGERTLVTKAYFDGDNKIKVYGMWPYDAFQWNYCGFLNSEDAQINYAGEFIDFARGKFPNGKEIIATAWRDSRTGNEEIFYAYGLLPIEGDVAEEHDSPNSFTISQNYPNPFNPATVINYTIPTNNAKVRIKVFNLLGKEIATLVNKIQNKGNYSVKFNANSLPSGIYFYQLQSGNFIKTRKMLLLK